MLNRWMLLILCLVFISRASNAQDSAGRNNANIHYGHLERWKEDNLQITAFTGNVELYHAGKVIKADTLIAWNKVDASGQASGNADDTVFNEVYAEGNIKVISEDDTLLADRFYYNFINDTGVSVNVEIRTSARLDNAKSEPLVIRAKMVYQLDKKTSTAHQAIVTTCTHGKPHYYFWASTIKFTDDEKGKIISFFNIVPHFWGIPFFYFPYYSKTLGEDNLLRSVHYERTYRFGKTLQSNWGINIDKYKRDENGEILKDSDGRYKTKRWGDLTLEHSYYERRGNGFKPSLRYNWLDYNGYIKGYYINDKGPFPTTYDRGLYGYFGEPLPTEETARYRIHAFHRQQLSDKIRADAEIYYLSDRMFQIEFFEREAKEEKSPESYVYLRRLDGNSGQTLLGRERLNKFQSQTEYLPALNYYLINEPLKYVPVYGSLNAGVSKLNLKYDEKTGLLSESLSRFDLMGELSSPHQIFFVKATPFISTRLTGYDKGVQQDNYLDRYVSSAGLRLFSQFNRVFDTKNKYLGINNIMHIVSLDARYNNNYQVTTAPSELINTDQIDQLNEFSEWYFEIRNRFKTRSSQAQPEDNNYNEFLNIGIAIEKYPSANRDTTSFNSSNYLYPMNWITLAPDKNGNFMEKKISNLNVDVLFTPNLPFSFFGKTEYNTRDHKPEVNTAGINLVPYAGWNVAVTERYIINSSNALSLGLSCTPVEKWQVSISEQYDFKWNAFINRNYSLQRDLHEFFLNFSITVDKGKDETFFAVTLTPKGIFKR
ncbi:MAG: hypothetical protein V1701_08720 [Planctomycetota bacterium]